MENNRLKAIKVSILPCNNGVSTKVLNSSGLFFVSTLPYPTRKKRVCMDCLGENTALCSPQSKKRVALIKRLLKHKGTQVKLAFVYKRINPSSALGAICVLETINDLEKADKNPSYHPRSNYV